MIWREKLRAQQAAWLLGKPVSAGRKSLQKIRGWKESRSQGTHSLSLGPQLSPQQQLHLHCNFSCCQTAPPPVPVSIRRAWPHCPWMGADCGNSSSSQCSLNSRENCGFRLLLISGCLNFPYFLTIQKVVHGPAALALFGSFLKVQNLRHPPKLIEFESAFF